MAAKMTQSQMVKELAAAVGVPTKVAKSFTVAYAEMAVREHNRITGTVLLNAVGIKTKNELMESGAFQARWQAQRYTQDSLNTGTFSDYNNDPIARMLQQFPDWGSNSIMAWVSMSPDSRTCFLTTSPAAGAPRVEA